MRILLLTHAFNSLTQRLHAELRADGHEISVEFDVNDAVTEEAVAAWRPDLVIAPFLKRAIPASVWQRYRCLVVHPGIPGDRGPSALDWAVLRGEARWGVTVLQATGEMDAGPVWSSAVFPMRAATKGSLYRNEVTEAAVVAVREALQRLAQGGSPTPQRDDAPGVRGRTHPLMRQADRALDWARDDTATILRKIRCADGFPGVRDEIAGVPCFVFDAHAESLIDGGDALPGTVLATREGALCRATVDGAVWIGHVKRAEAPGAFKLPACIALGSALAGIPERPLAPDAVVDGATLRDVVYEERGAVGYLHFPFYNGAMATAQCERLRAAFGHARTRPTRVIVLTGGPDFWSNGIHLNMIEGEEHPAEASWRNINAMNDLVRDIVCTDTHVTIAAMRGNAGAGGAFLALAADHVYARSGIVLNPHYRGMGNLYGSEYWTYLLPRRVAGEPARALVANRLPLLARDAAQLGLVDDAFGATHAEFEAGVHARANALAAAPDFVRRLAAKNARRATDEARKPLAAYRAEELARMQLNFFGFDPSYHVARYNFVAKVPRSRTPLHLALHRRRTAGTGGTVKPGGPASHKHPAVVHEA